MKRYVNHVFGLMSLVLVLNCGTKTPSASLTSKNSKLSTKQLGETITSDELKEHLYIYASDEFEGRETGTEGQKKAVNFLKSNYEKLEISGALADESYFQKVPLKYLKSSSAALSLNDETYIEFKDYVLINGVVSQNFITSEIVDLGYGIESNNYSDYEGLNVKDKVVLIKAGEPIDKNGNYTVNNSKEVSVWGSPSGFNEKFNLAIKKGAKAVFLNDDKILPRYAAYLKRKSQNEGSMVLATSKITTPKFLINKTLYNQFKSYGNLKLEIKNQSIAVDSENVAAFVKGSTYPDEVIVVSAHLDHEGVKDGKVYNGADDDGSGTVAILEIAEAFKTAVKNGQRPKRSVLFLHVTGEEKGLLGSQYYTDFDPLFPIENTVANLNIDMIGRTDPKRDGDRNYIYLIGSDRLSTELHDLSEYVNKNFTNITLDYTYNALTDPNRFYERSDHYNFAKYDIPVIFYFNGTHDDYHQPTDTPDKIQYDLLQNRTRLVFYTAWEIANRDKRLVVDKPTLK